MKNANDQSAPLRRSVPAQAQSSQHGNAFNRLRQLSHILDNAIPVPGTNYRVGVDPLLGLLPGVGDYLGTAFSAYIVVQAAQLGATKATLFRMVLNIAVDTLIGSVPILGDLFDVTWKANSLNLALLETYLNAPQTRQRVDWWFVVLLLVGLLAVVTATVALSLWALTRLLQGLS